MGEIYKISCKCGYVKELNIGGGISSCNLNMVNKIFIKDKLKEFEEYYEANEVQSFYIDNEFSLCEKCKEIFSVAVLKIELNNSKKIEIINTCPICSNKVKRLNDISICPKCGQLMLKEEIGHWD